MYFTNFNLYLLGFIEFSSSLSTFVTFFVSECHSLRPVLVQRTEALQFYVDLWTIVNPASVEFCHNSIHYSLVLVQCSTHWSLAVYSVQNARFCGNACNLIAFSSQLFPVDIKVTNILHWPFQYSTAEQKNSHNSKWGWTYFFLSGKLLGYKIQQMSECMRGFCLCRIESSFVDVCISLEHKPTNWSDEWEKALVLGSHQSVMQSGLYVITEIQFTTTEFRMYFVLFQSGSP